jgi:hypothetical protein
MPGYLLTDYTEKKLEITYGYFPPWRGGVLAISGCIVYVNIGYFNFDKTYEILWRVLKDWNGKAL